MPQSSDSPEHGNATNDPNRPPLVGVVVHWLVVLSALIGCAFAGWAIAGIVLAIVLGLAAAALWFGTFARVDPERLPTARLRVSGQLRLVIEIVLVAIASVGIWIAWNRAASETFMTVAAIDFAVRYQRIANLARAGR